MSKYQIIATIEGFNLEKKEIMLRGINKYCFEKEKEYWNIFEKPDTKDMPIFLNASNPIKLFETGMEVQHLLDHAFIERKKLKFELDENYCITDVFYAPN